jgi:hypothetical protein
LGGCGDGAPRLPWNLPATRWLVAGFFMARSKRARTDGRRQVAADRWARTGGHRQRKHKRATGPDSLAGCAVQALQGGYVRGGPEVSVVASHPDPRRNLMQGRIAKQRGFRRVTGWFSDRLACRGLPQVAAKLLSLCKNLPSSAPWRKKQAAGTCSSRPGWPNAHSAAAISARAGSRWSRGTDAAKSFASAFVCVIGGASLPAVPLFWGALAFPQCGTQPPASGTTKPPRAGKGRTGHMP